MSNTTTSSSWQTEFNDRIKAFSADINVPEEKVRSVLADLGADGKDERSLTIIDNEEYLPMGDLRQQFVESELTKLSLLRLGMAHLRGKTQLDPVSPTSDNLSEVAGAIKQMVASNRNKSDWSDEELINAYDIDATDVITVLSKRTHGRPCIVFNSDGSVNKEVSLQLIKAAKRGPTTNRFSVAGKVVVVYRAGEFVSKPIDESPFFPGVPLVEGYCAQSNTNWTGIDHQIRVLVRLYIKHIEKAPLSKAEMKRIWKDAQRANETKALYVPEHAHKIPTDFETEYSEAVLVYEELQNADQLPKLKLMPNQKPTVDNGFSDHKAAGYGLNMMLP